MLLPLQLDPNHDYSGVGLAKNNFIYIKIIAALARSTILVSMVEGLEWYCLNQITTSRLITYVRDVHIAKISTML